MKIASRLLPIVSSMCLPAVAVACPTCKDALGDGAASGFYWSTLFLIGMPFTVFAVAGGTVALVYWRAARAQESPWPSAGLEKE